MGHKSNSGFLSICSFPVWAQTAFCSKETRKSFASSITKGLETFLTLCCWKKTWTSKGENLPKITAKKCLTFALEKEKKYKLHRRCGKQQWSFLVKDAGNIKVEKATCRYRCSWSQQWIAGLCLRATVVILGSSIELRGTTPPDEVVRACKPPAKQPAI